MKMQDAAPLLQKLAPLPLPPFLLNDAVYDLLAENLPPSEQIVQPLRMLPPSHAARSLAKSLR